MAETAQAPVQTPLITQSVQEFMKEKGFTSVNRTVRENKSKYPYITFLKANNEAENIYFSKNSAVGMTEGVAIGKGFFEPFAIGITTNADGELRTKLVSVSRLDASDLF